MGNSDKIILDLCGGTGAWSRPYKEAGYDVRLVTLPDNDVRLYQPPDNVYGILAAPPCTHFSIAKTNGRPRDLKEGMEIVYACLGIIWESQYRIKKPYSRSSPLKFWALENPNGLLKWFLGKPAFVFQPYQFGDNYTKKTCLWGMFETPKDSIIYDKPPANTTVKELFNPAKMNRDFKKIAELRSITPPGFAKAFFEANR